MSAVGSAHRGDVAALQPDLACSWFQLTGDQVEVSRLACTIGADDCRQRIWSEAARHLIDGDMTTEVNAQAARFQRKLRSRLQSSAIIMLLSHLVCLMRLTVVTLN